LVSQISFNHSFNCVYPGRTAGIGKDARYEYEETIQRGYLEILEDNQICPSQSEYFQKVSTAAQRISAMILFTKEY
jgi:hypothetical protein